MKAKSLYPNTFFQFQHRFLKGIPSIICLNRTTAFTSHTQQSKNHLWFLPFHHVNACKSTEENTYQSNNVIACRMCTYGKRREGYIYVCVCVYIFMCFQFSHSVMSDSLWSHGLQHTRPPCPLPIPGVYLNSCPLSRWCHPTISSSVVPLSSCLQSFPASGFFSNESVLRIIMPKYWSFNFNMSPSNEYSGLISLRTDWLNLLVVQGTLKSLLQQHSSKASIFQPSAIFIVQLSHPYMTTGKTIPLTRQTFVGKVMSLLFNMLSRLVITFLPRSKR